MTVNELKIANIIVDPDYVVLDDAFTSEAGRMVFKLRHISLHKQQTVVAVCAEKMINEINNIITEWFHRTYKVPTVAQYLLLRNLGIAIEDNLSSEKFSDFLESLDKDTITSLIQKATSWSKFTPTVEEEFGLQWYRTALNLENVYTVVIDNEMYWLLFHIKEDIDEFVQRRDDEL